MPASSGGSSLETRIRNAAGAEESEDAKRPQLNTERGTW
jgi:hypothetical protein